MSRRYYGPDFPKETYIAHAYPESTVDLGEVVLNYAVTGSESSPALLLVPGLAESWWGYEAAMKLLEADLQIYAVDVRGQGRSSRTPGRYTLDNWGNDLVRFIERVIKRPTLVAGQSLGGLMAAWLSAYAPPGLVRAVYLEDATLFTSELVPAYGTGMRQFAPGYLFNLFMTYLGDQWRVGDWKGMQSNAPSMLPAWMQGRIPAGDEPPQSLKEFDPEHARAMFTGTAMAGCSHKLMLQSAKTSMLFTHHARGIDPETGIVRGATTDSQVSYARQLVEKAGQRFDYLSLPEKGHILHQEDTPLYASILKDWALHVA